MSEDTLLFFSLFSRQTLPFLFLFLSFLFFSPQTRFFPSQQSSSFQFNLAARDLLEVNILNISNLHLIVVCFDSTYVFFLFCCVFYICFYCCVYDID